MLAGPHEPAEAALRVARLEPRRRIVPPRLARRAGVHRPLISDHLVLSLFHDLLLIPWQDDFVWRQPGIDLSFSGATTVPPLPPRRAVCRMSLPGRMLSRTAALPEPCALFFCRRRWY